MSAHTHDHTHEQDLPGPQTSQSTTVVRRPPWSEEQLVEKYLQLRDRIAEVKKKQVEEMAKYTSVLETMGNWLLDDLNTHHAESIRTKTGTFYKSLRTSVKVEHWQTTLDYIRANEAWDLLEARVSKTGVAAVVADTGAPVPGVLVEQEDIINVRRPTAA